MRYSYPRYLNFQDKDNSVCVLNESHHRLTIDKLLERIGNRVFIDLTHSCPPCEREVAFKYATCVNARQVQYPYSLFRDTIVETAIDDIVLFGKAKPNDKEKLIQLHKDLVAFNKEKRYDAKPTTEDEKIKFLTSQNHPIKDFRVDKKDSKKYTIHLPLNRTFSLPMEMEIISSLSTIPPEAHFYGMYYTIYKDDGDGGK